MKKPCLIMCGKLFDGIHDELMTDMEILVEGNKITAVGRNLTRPEDAEIIDLKHLTVTPGMIDAHVQSDALAGDRQYPFPVGRVQHSRFPAYRGEMP